MDNQKFFSGRRERKITEFLFLVPTVLAFFLVIIIPFIIGIYYSFTDWDGVNVAKNVVGLANYKAIFTEPGFLHAFLTTVLFTLFNVIAVNVAAFLMALLVTSNVKGRNLYRAGFFVPNLIGGIVLGSIWQFIFSSILPAVGKALGWAWLSNSLITNANTVVGAMVTVNTWQYAGYIMMIYVASIQGISQQVMEAASVDGATYWTRVFKILMLFILPLAAAFVLRTKSFDGIREPYEYLKTCVLSCIIAFVIGAYDGFYGPGTGTFLILLLTSVAHLSLKEANGLTKAINLTTNITSLVVFLYNGTVLIPLGILAGLCNVAGNWIGVSFFDKKGGAVVKPVMLLVLAVFLVRTVLELVGG